MTSATLPPTNSTLPAHDNDCSKCVGTLFSCSPGHCLAIERTTLVGHRFSLRTHLRRYFRVYRIDYGLHDDGQTPMALFVGDGVLCISSTKHAWNLAEALLMGRQFLRVSEYSNDTLLHRVRSMRTHSLDGYGDCYGCYGYCGWYDLCMMNFPMQTKAIRWAEIVPL